MNAHVEILEPLTRRGNTVLVNPLVENVIGSFAKNRNDMRLLCQCLVNCPEHLADVVLSLPDRNEIELSWDPQYEHCQIQTQRFGSFSCWPEEDAAEEEKIYVYRKPENNGMDAADDESMHFSV